MWIFASKIFLEHCARFLLSQSFYPQMQQNINAEIELYKCIMQLKSIYIGRFSRHGLHFNAFGHYIQVKCIEWAWIVHWYRCCVCCTWKLKQSDIKINFHVYRTILGTRLSIVCVMIFLWNVSLSFYKIKLEIKFNLKH